MANGLYNRVSTAATSPAVTTQTYRGFSSISSETENYKLYDFALIKQDILNHFHTRQGERLMNPTFGTIIWDLLFEPMTEQVQNLILQNVNEIINYDPRVSASNVIVSPYESGIQIECILTYNPYNISEQMKLQFDQRNGFLVN